VQKGILISSPNDSTLRFTLISLTLATNECECAVGVWCFTRKPSRSLGELRIGHVILGTCTVSPLLSAQESQEWRDQCATLFGWLPLRPAEEKLNELKKIVDETKRQLDVSGDDTDAAKELRSSLVLYDTAVTETAAGVRQYRRGLLAQLGLDPDTYIP